MVLKYNNMIQDVILGTHPSVVLVVAEHFIELFVGHEI